MVVVVVVVRVRVSVGLAWREFTWADFLLGRAAFSSALLLLSLPHRASLPLPDRPDGLVVGTNTADNSSANRCLTHAWIIIQRDWITRVIVLFERGCVFVFNPSLPTHLPISLSPNP